MVKKCAFQGCERQINDYETYCQEHYSMVMQNSGATPKPQPPNLPPELSYLQKPKAPEKKRKFLKNLNDKDFLISKQVAFKGAVEIVRTMELDNYQAYVEIVENMTRSFQQILLTDEGDYE